MKRIEKQAKDSLDPMEKRCCAHCYQKGFRAAREELAHLFGDSWTNPKYAGLTLQNAMNAIKEDAWLLGEEDA